MTGWIGAIVASVVGAGLAGVTSFLLVTGLSETPQQSDAPLIVYGDNS